MAGHRTLEPRAGHVASTTRRQADLNQEEMAHILAFLYQAGTSDPAEGRRGRMSVFTDKGCAHCHLVGQPASNSGRQAPDLSHVAAAGDTAAWMRTMWNHAQYMIEPITREIGQWPQFKDDEMNDLIAYVSRTGGAGSPPAGGHGSSVMGSADRGWQVFQAECIACHSVGGRGGHTGPELGPELDLPHSLAQFAAVLWNHAPAMLKEVRAAKMTPPTLQGNEIADVLQFLISLVASSSPDFRSWANGFSRSGVAPFVTARKRKAPRKARGSPPGADAFTTVSLASALWRHGPAMRVHADRLGIAWPTLEAGDMGDLISFLNDRK